MAKRIFPREILLALFTIALFFQSHAMESDPIRITVRNEMEQIRAFGSNRVISVTEDSYINLYKVLEFSDLREKACVVDKKKLTNPAVFKFIDCEFRDNQQLGIVYVDNITENIQLFQCCFSDNEGILFSHGTHIALDKYSIYHVDDFGDVSLVKDMNCSWSHTEMKPEIRKTDEVPAVPILYYLWEGQINNRKIRLACARQEKVLIGELMMKNEVGTEFLRVLGMIDTDGEILFNVYDTESPCALRQTFLGRIIGNTLDCFEEATQTEFKLRAYKGNVRYAMDRKADAYCSPFSKSTIYYFKADNRELAGGYSFVNMASYSEHYGRIDISRSGDDLEVMELSIDYKNKGRQALADGKAYWMVIHSSIIYRMVNVIMNLRSFFITVFSSFVPYLENRMVVSIPIPALKVSMCKNQV